MMRKFCRIRGVSLRLFNTQWGINRQHFSEFLHNRLWIGLPFAAAVAFGLTLLLGVVIRDEAMVEVMKFSGINAALVAFSWIIGIWAATGPDVPEEDREAADWVDRKLEQAPRLLRHIITICGILFLMGIFIYFQIEDYLLGEETLFETLARIAVEILSITAVILPIGLYSKDR